VTHSVQLPAGEGKSSGGQPEFIEPLARAGAAIGVDGVFLEVHDHPAKALSDGTNALALDRLRPLLEKIVRLSALAREWDSPSTVAPRVVARATKTTAEPRRVERRKWRAR
jgi:2-dehydro-3-deoxyphosphooctonate aldolase (KDO 8-P synthase)